MLPTSHYGKQRAERAVNFIQALRHTKGEVYNKPFMLLDGQETIIRDLFGIIREDRTRQFRQAIIFTPKKGGKTELATTISLYLLCAEGGQRTEIYGAAVDRQQASLIYSVAADMIRLTPDAERAEQANCEVQVRLLLELVDKMVKNSLPEWMAREVKRSEKRLEPAVTTTTSSAARGTRCRRTCWT